MALLQNHIAVVTGAGSGIGRAIAIGYAREGARVVLLDREEKAAAEAAQEIRGAGGKAESFGLDVAKREDCVAMAKHVVFSEAALVRMSGMPDPAQALRWARPRVAGPYVGVTIGARGYLWLEGDTLHDMPAYRVDAIDTLGAGDVFHGAYALALAEGREVREAARFANAAAAIKCTRASGRRGIPLRAEVDAWLARSH